MRAINMKPFAPLARAALLLRKTKFSSSVVESQDLPLRIEIPGNRGVSLSGFGGHWVCRRG